MKPFTSLLPAVQCTRDAARHGGVRVLLPGCQCQPSRPMLHAQSSGHRLGTWQSGRAPPFRFRHTVIRHTQLTRPSAVVRRHLALLPCGASGAAAAHHGPKGAPHPPVRQRHPGGCAEQRHGGRDWRDWLRQDDPAFAGKRSVAARGGLGLLSAALRAGDATSPQPDNSSGAAAWLTADPTGGRVRRPRAHRRHAAPPCGAWPHAVRRAALPAHEHRRLVVLGCIVLGMACSGRSG